MTVIRQDTVYNSVDKLIKDYGDTIVGISFMPQVLFYIEHGIQPEYVFPKENNENRATFWFLKDKTYHLKKLWDATKETNDMNKRGR